MRNSFPLRLRSRRYLRAPPPALDWWSPSAGNCPVRLYLPLPKPKQFHLDSVLHYANNQPSLPAWPEKIALPATSVSRPVANPEVQAKHHVAPNLFQDL